MSPLPKEIITILSSFAPQGRLVLGLDETLERCRGAQIGAQGICRDPVRSRGHHLVKASGLRWLLLMLVAPCSGPRKLDH